MKLASLAFVLASFPAVAAAQDEPPPSPPEPAPAPAPTPAPAPISPAVSSSPYVYAPRPLAASSAEAAEIRPHRPPHYDYLRFGAGVRVGYIGSSGFDAFADNDVLTQVSLDATYAFYTRGKLAVSGGLAWDVGSRSSGARGVTTSLTANRLSVPIEARWYFAPWFNAFAKVAPGTVALHAQVRDASSPAPLEDTPWVFATDLSAGASFRLAGSGDHDVRRARLWITHEVGYGFTSSHSLRPAPSRNEEDVLGSDQGMRLGELALNGVFWRTGLALSF